MCQEKYQATAAKQATFLEENLGAAGIALAAAEVAELDAAVPPGAAAGPRYGERQMRDIDG